MSYTREEFGKELKQRVANKEANEIIKELEELEDKVNFNYALTNLFY